MPGWPSSTDRRRYFRAAWLACALCAIEASADDLAVYDRALAAFAGGDYDAAAERFHQLAENSKDAEVRAKAEHYLAETLARKSLWAAALVYRSAVLKAGKSHPFYLQAIEGLVDAQRQLGDEYLIPNLLSGAYRPEWRALRPEVLARIHYLLGGISQRKGKLEEARAFLESVPKKSEVYAKSRYLLGVVLIDPQYPGGPQTEEAIRVFQEVIAIRDQEQLDLERTQQLATLGLGRAYYGAREYAKAVKAYERVPRFSAFWDQALLENGFARFQNNDPGGALGSLQSLHAPQFEGAFQPESWILQATVYYFNCLYQESKGALAAFDARYLPIQERLQTLIAGEKTESDELVRWVATQSEQIPRPVSLWIRGNERMLGALRVLEQIDRELSAIRSSAWMKSTLGTDLVRSLEELRGTMLQVAGQLARNRLVEAAQNIKGFTDQAEIIRFETTKAEKEMAEAGIDQGAILAQQKLYRPALPGDDWEYWKFDGEFWIDEIGYYAYTLKRGCAASGAAKPGVSN
jgi:tetratricopeptide (TPR) repeat protein